MEPYYAASIVEEPDPDGFFADPTGYLIYARVGLGTPSRPWAISRCATRETAEDVAAILNGIVANEGEPT